MDGKQLWLLIDREFRLHRPASSSADSIYCWDCVYDLLAFAALSCVRAFNKKYRRHKIKVYLSAVKLGESEIIFYYTFGAAVERDHFYGLHLTRAI